MLNLKTTSLALALFAAAFSQAAAHPGHHFGLKSAKAVTITADVLANKTGTTGQISGDKKTLTFDGSDINLVVTTGPENDMLSYRIQGLRNPTLSIPAGATLHVLFVNSDDDMSHDIRFADQLAPYGSDAKLTNSAGSHDLDHKSEKGMHAEQLVLTAPTVPGKHAYLCNVSGHAKGGMFGTVIVR